MMLRRNNEFFLKFFYILCLSLLNLCLSADKKILSKKKFPQAHAFEKIKGPESYLFFYLALNRLGLGAENEVYID